MIALSFPEQLVLTQVVKNQLRAMEADHVLENITFNPFGDKATLYDALFACLRKLQVQAAQRADLLLTPEDVHLLQPILLQQIQALEDDFVTQDIQDTERHTTYSALVDLETRFNNYQAGWNAALATHLKRDPL